jgi:hypothetical protein
MAAMEYAKFMSLLEVGIGGVESLIDASSASLLTLTWNSLLHRLLCRFMTFFPRLHSRFSRDEALWREPDDAK